MNYAPVIIPTLCRYSHFRDLMESLACCTLASETDVIVALDYPLYERHKEGYSKIDSYLRALEHNPPFKKLEVIRRERNYGLSKGGNMDSLIVEVLRKYDSYIFTEDDNVVSPNFLVYMNEGLQRFKEDRSVLAINAYRHYYPIKIAENTFFRQNVDFSAWGYAIWKDRIENLKSILHPSFFRKGLAPKIMVKVWKKNGLNRLATLLCLGSCPEDRIMLIDNVFSVYMALEDKDVVMPSVSLVRNMGIDGSGAHFVSKGRRLEDFHKEQPIDDHTTFVFKGDGKEYYEENRKIFRSSSYGKFTLKQFARAVARTGLNYASAFLRVIIGRPKSKIKKYQ